MSNAKRYQKIVNPLVNRSFPILRNETIYIKEKKMKYGAMARHWLFFYSIEVGNKIKDYSKFQLKGGLAHELSHIETFKKQGFFLSAYKSFLAIFSSSLTRGIERETDMLAIGKGYGNQLYSMRERNLSEADKETRERIKKYYMSLNEIRQYMRGK